MLHRALQSESLRWLVLAWVLLFFGLIVPGHRRGIVQLSTHGSPASPLADGAAKPFCPLCTSTSTDPDTKPDPTAPINCAICHLKAQLDTPPPFILIPTRGENLAYLLRHVSTFDAPASAVLSTLRGRPPPVA